VRASNYARTVLRAPITALFTPLFKCAQKKKRAFGGEIYALVRKLVSRGAAFEVAAGVDNRGELVSSLKLGLNTRRVSSRRLPRGNAEHPERVAKDVLDDFAGQFSFAHLAIYIKREWEMHSRGRQGRGRCNRAFWLPRPRR